MVLGLFEGKIEIKPEKMSYVSGDTIRGQVVLTLNQAKKANELRIMFYGEYKVRRGKHSTTERIFEQTINLEGQKEYPARTSTYSFEINIPQYAPKEAWAISLGPIKLFPWDDPVKRAKWHLDASLNMPMSFDINKKMQIMVSF